MDLLARREHSCYELKNKLLAKGFTEDLVTKVLDDLAKEQLQSDKRFTENYIVFKMAHGFGPVYIQHELQKRGVTSVLIEESLNQNNDFWLQRIKQVRTKKFGQNLPQNLQERGRQSRFLLMRGFNYYQVQQGLNDDGN